MTSRIERIEKELLTLFTPTFLEIRDESHRHAGHLDPDAGLETHLFIEMHAPVFKDQSRIAQQRLVMKALDHEFKNGLHALRLKLCP